MATAPDLTATVAAVAAELGGRVSAEQIVAAILRRHPEYGDRQAFDVAAAVPWPARMRRVPVGRCLADVAALFRPDTHTPLHGRAVIVGVALVDRDAGRAMIESGLFGLIAKELRPPLAESVSDEGAARLEAMPLAGALGGKPPEPVVTYDSGALRGLFFTLDSDGLLIARSDPDRVILWRDRSSVIIEEDTPVTGALVRNLRARLRGAHERWSHDGRVRADLIDGDLLIDEGEGTRLMRGGGDTVAQRLDPDGREVVVFGGEERFMVGDLSTGTWGDPVAYPEWRDAALCNDSLAVFGIESVWVNGETVGIGRTVTDVAWRPDTRVLAIADEDGGVTLWSPGVSRVVGHIQHEPGLRAVTFSPDGRRLAAGNDRTIWVSEVGLPERRRFASYDADTARGDNDLLDIDNDVEAFATLIAARTLVPPLSIGLFGNWGSGKSFFMRRLRRQVWDIAREARESGRVQQDVDFYKYIAQVEFNVWHYAEGNLWASLVQNIFENLHVETAVDDRTARAKRADRLLRRTEAKLAEASVRAVSAAYAVEESANRVTALESAHQIKLQALEEERQRDALRRMVGDYAFRAVADATAPFGIAPVTASGRDVLDSYQRARREVDGVLPFLRVLASPRDPNAQRLRAGLFAAVAGGLLLVGLAVAFRSHAARVASLLSGLTVVLTGGAAWLERFGRWVGARRAELDQAGTVLQGEIDDARQEYAVRLADLQAEASRVQAELQAALAAQEQMVAELARQRTEQQLPPARLLGRLIEDRLDSGDYRKHLGVLALIREDFSDIADMVAESNAALARSDDLDAENIDDRVDRIVLYIDDLDRCPPRRVVEVLEAVHLLLAFELFVVVVGVDARWVLKALEAHYWELLGDEDGEGSARPIDYVEKIFQVPYQLRPLSTEVTQTMLAGLVPLTAEGPSPPPRTPTGVGNGEPARPSSVPAAQSASDPTAARPRGRARDLTPGSLSIETAELAAMQELAPLLGSTPRTIKRFVNLYRLMKVRFQNRPDFHKDRGDATEYRLVMFLLAICAGRTDEAPALLAELVRTDPEKALGEVPPVVPLLALLGDAGTARGKVPVGAYLRFVEDVKRFSFVLDAI